MKIRFIYGFKWPNNYTSSKKVLTLAETLQRSSPEFWLWRENLEKNEV